MTFRNLCLLGSLILLLLFTFTGESHSETVKLVLTPEERALIDEVYNAGVLDDAGWARFFERVKYSPRREGAIHKALNDESIGSRIERDIYRLSVHVFDPNHTLNYFAEHGLWSVLKIIVMPLRGFARVLSGELGEYPLTTFFQFLVVVGILWHLLPRVIRYCKHLLPRLIGYCKAHFRLQ